MCGRSCSDEPLLDSRHDPNAPGGAQVTIRHGATAAVRGLLERLPAPARMRIRSNRDVFRGLVQLKRNQALLAARVADLEDSRGKATPPAEEPADPHFPPGVRSRVCTQAQLAEPWFRTWCEALGEAPRAHRKLWEHAYLAHVLDALELLRPGRQGVGFGVGREPLVAAFAGRGCRIVATDLPPAAEEARAWRNTNQHAVGLDGLARDGLCDPERLRELVTWRPVDMRAIPDDLTGFDFCWSACSLEHLGSLEAGMSFVERSVATLAPGGIAVHTTEYNLSSDDTTVDSGPTVLYRGRDLRALADRLEAAGHRVAALDLDPGDGVLDRYVDVPPYFEEPHLRVWYGRFTTTSMALVIRAAG